jgi:hypothetical protein
MVAEIAYSISFGVVVASQGVLLLRDLGGAVKVGRQGWSGREVCVGFGLQTVEARA